MLIKIVRFFSSRFGKLGSEIVRGSFGTFVLKVINTGFNFVIAIVLARFLEPEGYGIYGFVLSIIAFLSIPVKLGLPILLLREIARYHQGKNWSYLKGILKFSNLSVFVISILVTFCSILFIWLYSPEERLVVNTFYWSLFLLPLGALNLLREGALQGLRKVIQAQIPDKVLQPLFFLILIYIAYYFFELRPPLAMLLFSVAASLSFIIGSILLFKGLPDGVRYSKPSFEYRKWLKSILPLSLLGGLLVINNQTDVFMLGLMASNEDVGLYKVAYSGAALVIFSLTAVIAAVSPHIAQLYSRGDTERLQRIVTMSTQITFAIALPIVLVFMFYGESILELVFGEAYRKSYTALMILCIAQLISVSVGFVHAILNMSGHEQKTVRGTLYSGLMNIILNALLIPYYGLIGAAIASAVSILIVSIYLCYMVWKETGIWSFIFKPIQKI